MTIPQTLNTPVPVTPFNPTLPAILTPNGYLGINSAGNGIAILPPGGGPPGPPGPPGSGAAFTVQAITASGAVTGVQQFVTVDATSGAIGVSLPSYGSVAAGSQIILYRLDPTANIVTVVDASLTVPSSVSPTPGEAYLIGQSSQLLLTATASGWDCAPLSAPITLLPITTNADLTLPPGSYAVAVDVSSNAVTVTLCSGGSQVTASPLIAVWVEQPGISPLTLVVDDAGTISGQSSLTAAVQFMGWLVCGDPETDNYVVLSYIALPPVTDDTWTPFDNSGASLTFSAAAGQWVQTIAPDGVRQFCTQGTVTYPTTSDTTGALIAGGGLPAPINAIANIIGTCMYGTSIGFVMAEARSTDGIQFFTAAGVGLRNVDLSGLVVSFALTYFH